MTVFLFVLAALVFLLLLPFVTVSLLTFCAIRSKLEYPELLSKEISLAVMIAATLILEGGLWYYMYSVYALPAQLLAALPALALMALAFRKSRQDVFNKASRQRFFMLGLAAAVFAAVVIAFILRAQGIVSF